MKMLMLSNGFIHFVLIRARYTFDIFFKIKNRNELSTETSKKLNDKSEKCNNYLQCLMHGSQHEFFGMQRYIVCNLTNRTNIVHT